MQIQEESFKPQKLQFILPLIGFLFFFVLGWVVILSNVSIAIFLFLMSGPLFFATVVIGSRRLIIGPHGIAQQSLLGRKEMKWSNVTDAQFRVKATSPVMSGALGGALLAAALAKSREHYITLISSHNGMIIELNPGFPHVEEISKFVLNEVPPRKVNQIIIQTHQGQEAAYGRLRISATGLRIGRKEILWKELESYEVTDNPIGFTMTFHTNKFPKPLTFIYDDHVAREVIRLLIDKKTRKRRESS